MTVTPPRVTATCLVLTMAAALLAGCGSGSASSNASVTKTQAAAFAKAVNLRQGDLPATRPGLPQLSVFVPRSGSGVFFCAHGTDATSRSSPVFSPAIEGDGMVAISGVRVMPSRQLAALDVSALAVRHRRVCGEAPSRQQAGGGPLARRVDVPADQPAVGVRTVSVVPRAAVPGTPQTRFYTDTFVFVVGPAEMALIAASVQKPPPPVLERRLVSLLYSRAEANKLA
jgi:hypothetical protein